MFRISQGKGFSIEFANGYRVSVQFGPGNYCEHYDRDIGQDEIACGKEGSADAECAVFAPVLGMIQGPEFDGDTVRGRMSPKEVLDLMIWAEAQRGEGK